MPVLSSYMANGSTGDRGELLLAALLEPLPGPEERKLNGRASSGYVRFCLFSACWATELVNALCRDLVVRPNETVGAITMGNIMSSSMISRNPPGDSTRVRSVSKRDHYEAEVSLRFNDSGKWILTSSSGIPCAIPRIRTRSNSSSLNGMRFVRKLWCTHLIRL